MFSDVKLLNLASAKAQHAAKRHELISENIANADTPGFKAKDLEPFSQTYSKAASAARAEGADEFEIPEWRSFAVNTPGLKSPNGNTVSLEDQMIRSVEAQGDHDAAMTVYRKTLDILRLSLGRDA
ncbi:MAG: FlgB family protein [Parvularculaceae bacterium]